MLPSFTLRRFHSVAAGMFPKGEADLVHHLMAQALKEVCSFRHVRSKLLLDICDVLAGISFHCCAASLRLSSGLWYKKLLVVVDHRYTLIARGSAMLVEYGLRCVFVTKATKGRHHHACFPGGIAMFEEYVL